MPRRAQVYQGNRRGRWSLTSIVQINIIVGESVLALVNVRDLPVCYARILGAANKHRMNSSMWDDGMIFCFLVWFEAGEFRFRCRDFKFRTFGRKSRFLLKEKIVNVTSQKQMVVTHVDVDTSDSCFDVTSKINLIMDEHSYDHHPSPFMQARSLQSHDALQTRKIRWDWRRSVLKRNPQLFACSSVVTFALLSQASLKFIILMPIR